MRCSMTRGAAGGVEEGGGAGGADGFRNRTTRRSTTPAATVRLTISAVLDGAGGEAPWTGRCIDEPRGVLIREAEPVGSAADDAREAGTQPEQNCRLS